MVYCRSRYFVSGQWSQGAIGWLKSKRWLSRAVIGWLRPNRWLSRDVIGWLKFSPWLSRDVVGCEDLNSFCKVCFAFVLDKSFVRCR